jgi:hypothetical protein
MDEKAAVTELPSVLPNFGIVVDDPVGRAAPSPFAAGPAEPASSSVAPNRNLRTTIR